jgi:hypothetical protein
MLPGRLCWGRWLQLFTTASFKPPCPASTDSLRQGSVRAAQRPEGARWEICGIMPDIIFRQFKDCKKRKIFDTINKISRFHEPGEDHSVYFYRNSAGLSGEGAKTILIHRSLSDMLTLEKILHSKPLKTNIEHSLQIL